MSSPGDNDDNGTWWSRLEDGINGFAATAMQHPPLGTAFLRGFGLTKIPLLWFLRPRLIELNDERTVIEIPLSWRSKNHLGAMYFGALVVGADLAGGLMAMRCIMASKARVALVFKDLRAEFLRRAEGDVRFTCEAGQKSALAVAKAIETGERINELVEVVATVPRRNALEPVARFALTLSLKRRSA
jgi:acyl-coenzyme A thioesterase PaaI-like protein